MVFSQRQTRVSIPRIPVPEGGAAGVCARAILSELGVDSERIGAASGGLHPDLEWARSGAMWLTGEPEGIPRLAPGPLASCARGALLALEALCAQGSGCLGVDAAALLGERAAHSGFTRRGATSVGGSSRILRARDGWLAVNLPRADDLALLPAWLEDGDADDAVGQSDEWERLERRLPQRPQGHWLERARLLGLAVSAVPDPVVKGAGSPWLKIRRGHCAPRRRTEHPLVIDLSSLWAGPLCAQLLGLAGARVIKVESADRPDGAREGSDAFFDGLHAGHESVALDFGSAAGRERLAALIGAADIVIEASRPRALRQLGISAEAQIAERPGLTWVGITGYGREEPMSEWVAFGDDAAVAAGAVVDAEVRPLFCADAIADPLTGLHAAPAAWASWLSGESRVLDISLCAVTRHAVEFEAPVEEAAVEADPETHGIGWRVRLDDRVTPVLPARARQVVSRSAGLGADTERVLAEFGIR